MMRNLVPSSHSMDLHSTKQTLYIYISTFRGQSVMVAISVVAVLEPSATVVRMSEIIFNRAISSAAAGHRLTSEQLQPPEPVPVYITYPYPLLQLG